MVILTRLIFPLESLLTEQRTKRKKTEINKLINNNYSYKILLNISYEYIGQVTLDLTNPTKLKFLFKIVYSKH